VRKDSTQTVGDTITLVAGILLTSVGLLALLPFVLRLGRKGMEAGNPLEDALIPALAAADAFMHPESHYQTAAVHAQEGVNDDVEELMSHLFSLRMTVSEIAFDVQEVQESLTVDTPEDSAAVPADDEEAREVLPDRKAEPAA
jgi:hypothetical protein